MTPNQASSSGGTGSGSTRLTAPVDIPPSTASTTTTRIELDDESQIRALIDSFWAEWLRAGDPPDPQRGEFTRLLTGDSLEREVADLEKKLALQEARRLPENARFTHVTTSVDVAGDTARVTECVVDDSQLVDLKDGKVLNGAIASYQLEKVVVRQNGTWLLESSSISSETDGIQPCA